MKRSLALSATLLAAILAYGGGAYAASRDTRSMSGAPTEVYGARHQSIVLRIGNDSLGSSGLMRALADDYLASHRIRGAIAWYQDSDANALAKLQGGHVDMAILANRDLLDEAVASKIATHPSEVFVSHAVLVGPRSNPARVLPGDSAAAAFAKIARFGTLRVTQGGAPVFLSRDDRSAYNEKERELWRRAGLAPWTAHDLWYRCDHVFSRRALTDAHRESLYTLTDQATWRSMKKNLPHMRSYISGSRDFSLSNVVVLRPFPSKRVQAFLAYLESDRAQSVVATFQR